MSKIQFVKKINAKVRKRTAFTARRKSGLRMSRGQKLNRWIRRERQRELPQLPGETLTEFLTGSVTLRCAQLRGGRSVLRTGPV